jgi:hypothetical protein
VHFIDGGHGKVALMGMHTLIMNELKFFLLMRVLTQNFNTLDLVKFLEKNKKLHI